MTIVEYARERGPVAPFYTIIDGACNCPSGLKKRGLCRPGKHPIVKKTKGSKGGYYRATRDLKQVQQWHKKWPWAEWHEVRQHSQAISWGLVWDSSRISCMYGHQNGMCRKFSLTGLSRYDLLR